MSVCAWKRPLLLAAASLAIVSGTACAAYTPQDVITGIGRAAGAGDLVGRFVECGKGGDGGDGGKGGEGGRPGAPGEPGEPGKSGLAGCVPLGELPDKPKGALSVVDKVRIVMAVLSGDRTSAEVAEKYEVPEGQIETWKRQFLGGDWPALIKADILPAS